MQEFKGRRREKADRRRWRAAEGKQSASINGECMFINENEARVFNDQEAPRYKFKNCIIANRLPSNRLKAFPFGGRILSSTKLSNCKTFRSR